MKYALIAAACGLSTVTSPALAECYQVIDGGETITPLDGYEVSALAPEPGVIPVPELSEGVSAIMCDRDTVVPEPDDFELVRYRGVPLMIREGAGEDATILTLLFRRGGENDAGEAVPPQYAVQLPQGSLSEEDRAGIIAAIEGFAAGETALNAYLAEQAEEEDGGQDG